MYYCGILKGTKTAEVFYSRINPAEEKFRNFYGFLFGGYKTKNKAFEVASYQFGHYATIRFHDNRTKESRTNHNLYAIAGIE